MEERSRTLQAHTKPRGRLGIGLPSFFSTPEAKQLERPHIYTKNKEEEIGNLFGGTRKKERKKREKKSFVFMSDWQHIDRD